MVVGGIGTVDDTVIPVVGVAAELVGVAVDNIVKVDIKAVSYTHLDVYKRQP